MDEETRKSLEYGLTSLTLIGMCYVVGKNLESVAEELSYETGIVSTNLRYLYEFTSLMTKGFYVLNSIGSFFNILYGEIPE